MLKNLMTNCNQFRTNEVPRKQDDKNRLETIFDDFQVCSVITHLNVRQNIVIKLGSIFIGGKTVTSFTIEVSSLKQRYPVYNRGIQFIIEVSSLQKRHPVYNRGIQFIIDVSSLQLRYPVYN